MVKKHFFISTLWSYNMDRIFVIINLHSIFLNYQNALTDPQRVQTPSIMEYWKPLAEDVSFLILLQ